MTPAELTAHLDARVYGASHASGETDGVPWDVLPRPRTGRWRVTVAVRLTECPRGIALRYDSEDAAGMYAILGRFVDTPDAAPVVAEVATWRAVTR